MFLNVAFELPPVITIEDTFPVEALQTSRTNGVEANGKLIEAIAALPFTGYDTRLMLLGDQFLCIWR